MSVIEEAKEWLKAMTNGGYCETSDCNKVIENLLEELEQHKAITEAAKFLVKVKRHKDVKGKGAVYLASWPIALRKIEEAVDNLGEDDESIKP